MANLDKIRVIENGVSTDYDVDGGTSSEVELPIDYNGVYDTDEHQIGWYAVTGGYKSLYRKIIEVSIPANSTSGSFGYVTDLCSADIEQIITVNGYSYKNDHVGTSLNLYVTSSEFMRFWINDTKELYYHCNSNNSIQYWRFVMCYTKTTDEVATEIPKQTIPAIVQKEGEVYSTEEQVIGTWIDGKPIYRKTITISSLPNNDSAHYNIFDDESIIDSVWIDEGNSFININNLKYPINWIWSSTAMFFSGIDNKKLKLKATENQSANTGIYTLKYTKTTD